MKKYFLLLSLLSLFTGSQAFAQAKKEFSADPKEFIDDLKTFYDSDKRDESIQTIKLFAEMWEKNPFTPTEQAQIIAFANVLQKEKVRIFPDYNAWLSTLMAYRNGKATEDKLTRYHSTGKLVIDKAKKDFKDYSVTAGLLFLELAIAKNEAKTWRVSNANYEFEFKNSIVSVYFPQVELMLLTREDTMGVYQTTGRYYPAAEKWEGKGGQVYWTRVGFSRSSVYAKVNNYSINTRHSEYKADSVELFYPQKFGKSILGRFEDKATTDYLGPKASYPRFQSYQAVFELKNIFRNVDYKGGFALEGQQILGTGTDSTKAMLVFHYNNKVALRAYAKAFVINPDKIASDKATVAIYLDKDSVFHSQLIFNYVEKDRKLTLSRDEQGMYAAPFFDSYHQLEYRVGNMVWPIDEPLISLKTNANPDQPAEFESSDRYSQGNYMRMQTILDYNPLARLTRYVGDNKERVITMDELAAYFNNKPQYLQNLLFQLANEGFIFYDVDAQKIYVKDKLLHYYYSAEKNEDYDIIKFESVISARPNATISLLSQDLKIEGVRGINLSDTQVTYIIPLDQTVIIKKNRDMVFSGNVHSGRFDFWGNDFLFNYTRFNITFNNIDSVKFQFPEYKEGRMTGMRTIQNTLQNVSGFLYIDGHNNKSGKIKMEDYPIFECTKESYVYYDKKHIYNGVYDRNRFYYQVNPFTIKRLDDFTAEGLRFPGSFTSADILPVIQNDLTIQEDFSLGFKQTSPAGGYPLYKGKGTGHGLFLLSNSGLRGQGEIDYLASKTTSQNVIFFPDSMNSRSDNFVLAQTEIYPSMTGKGTYNHWMPYKDSMYIYKGKEPISVYNGKIDFDGSFALTPAALAGTGTMDYQNLGINSKSFAFYPSNITTKSGEVGIDGVAGQRKALTATDMKIDLDLTKEFGTFSANKDTTQIMLPQNRYATTLNDFTYDMAKKEIAFVKKEKVSEDNAYFVSTNPEQLALKFNSKKATLDLNKSEILAQDVPYLSIGDSRIYTPNKEVTVEKEGGIATIKGAEIVSDVDLQYHKVYNARVNVFSRNKFTAYGNYDYIDRNAKKFVLTLNDVRTDENGKTTGKGVIADTANFYLSPGLKYSGNVGFTARKKDLGFDGYVLAENQNKLLKTEYVKITDTIDPKNVVLNISTPVARDGKELFTGTFMTGTDKPQVYNMLFGRKNDYVDAAIFSVTGALYYDDRAGEFRVGPKEKVIPAADGGTADFVEGNLFRYSPDKNVVNTEGVYNFGADLKHVELATAGSYYYKYSDTSHMFNVVMLVNFPLGEEAGKILTDSLLENSYDNLDVENNTPAIMNAFAMLMKNKKEKEKVLAEIPANGFVPITDELSKTFIFTEVKINFSDTSKTFITSGELGMANALKVPVNKRMKGVMEITKKRSGDKYALLIESAGGSYHYFQYAGGYLSHLSSDYVFSDKITETAEKVEKGKGNFKYKPATMREIKMLKRKQRNR